MASSTWAINQLSQILPLDNESLQQMLDYTSTLSKDAAAQHLKDILGDSPKALEFISSYNARRQAPVAGPPALAEPPAAVPRSQPKKKGKAPLHKLPPARQVENHGDTTGAYQKREQEDYMSGKKRHQNQEPAALANTLALSDNPPPRQSPKPTTTSSLKPPPSASGPLLPNLPNVRTNSRTPSRNPSPTPPKTTVSISGGAAMHGASTTLQDLDSAIRTLELQTNPTLTSSTHQPPSTRTCNCNATLHPLLTAAPNCLSCGQIICAKQGLGPCTFCHTPLLSSADITAMIDALKQERGAEKMRANNASQRRADVTGTAAAPRPFTPPSSSATSNQQASTSTLDLAKQHRDRLLQYQSQNAQRTTVRDEAADYDTPVSGLSQWASPVERAQQLKRQQKVLREQEWNARPEYEKRRVVVSVDLVGGKVVKRMGEVERDSSSAGGGGGGGRSSKGKLRHDVEDVQDTHRGASADGGKGAFSANPLLGDLIRPVWKPLDESMEDRKGKSGMKNETAVTDAAVEEDKENAPRMRKYTWRRVQDDNDDNEAVILDGGVYGGRGGDLGEEPRSG